MMGELRGLVDEAITLDHEAVSFVEGERGVAGARQTLAEAALGERAGAVGAAVMARDLL